MDSFNNKFLRRMFRRIGGLVWDVTTGSVGLKTENGIYTVTFNDAGEHQLNVNPLADFGLALPAFATQATHDEVNRGDIIVGDQGVIGWVVSKTESAFQVVDHNGYKKQYSPPKVAIMGVNGVLVVRNLFSLTGNGANANNFAANMLPLLLLGKEGDAKCEQLLPFLLMQSASGNTNAGLNSLLPLLMLKGNKNDGGSLEKLLMMQALAGGGTGGAMNPMMMFALLGDTDIFGKAEVAPSATPPLTVRHSAAFPPPLTQVR